MRNRYSKPFFGSKVPVAFADKTVIDGGVSLATPRDTRTITERRADWILGGRVGQEPGGEPVVPTEGRREPIVVTALRVTKPTGLLERLTPEAIEAAVQCYDEWSSVRRVQRDCGMSQQTAYQVLGKYSEKYRRRYGVEKGVKHGR